MVLALKGCAWMVRKGGELGSDKGGMDDKGGGGD